jgi:hypothetical protein
MVPVCMRFETIRYDSRLVYTFSMHLKGSGFGFLTFFSFHLSGRQTFAAGVSEVGPNQIVGYGNYITGTCGTPNIFRFGQNIRHIVLLPVRI